MVRALTSRTPHPRRRRPLDGGFRRVGRERGSAAVEAAVGVPAFALFLALIILAGRIATAGQAVEAAAADAARSASIARTQSSAAEAAAAAAARSLATQQLSCSTTRVTVDAAGFTTPVGQPATVTATVSCEVRLADLAIPGLPGTRTVTATMTSPLDTYRGRALPPTFGTPQQGESA